MGLSLLAYGAVWGCILARVQSSSNIPQPKSFNCTSQPAETFTPIILKNGDVEARYGTGTAVVAVVYSVGWSSDGQCVNSSRG